jgi:hypothetical protein
MQGDDPQRPQEAYPGRAEQMHHTGETTDRAEQNDRPEDAPDQAEHEGQGRAEQPRPEITNPARQSSTKQEAVARYDGIPVRKSLVTALTTYIMQQLPSQTLMLVDHHQLQQLPSRTFRLVDHHKLRQLPSPACGFC